MFGYNVTQMVSVATGEDMHISCLVKYESIYRNTYIDFHGQEGLTFDHHTCYIFCGADSQIEPFRLIGNSMF